MKRVMIAGLLAITALISGLGLLAAGTYTNANKQAKASVDLNGIDPEAAATPENKWSQLIDSEEITIYIDKDSAQRIVTNDPAVGKVETDRVVWWQMFQVKKPYKREDGVTITPSHVGKDGVALTHSKFKVLGVCGRPIGTSYMIPVRRVDYNNSKVVKAGLNEKDANLTIEYDLQDKINDLRVPISSTDSHQWSTLKAACHQVGLE